MTSKGSFLSPDRNRHPHAKASLTTGERTRSQRLRRDLAAGDMLQHLEHCAAAPPHNKEGLDRPLAGAPEAAAQKLLPLPTYNLPACPGSYPSATSSSPSPPSA